MQKKDASTNTARLPYNYTHSVNEQFPMSFLLQQKKRLENVMRRYDIEGMNVVIESRASESDALTTRSFTFSFAEYVNRSLCLYPTLPHADVINQLILRIQILQDSFQKLLLDLEIKVLCLKEEYKDTNYTITSTMLTNPTGIRTSRSVIRAVSDFSRQSGECDLAGYRIRCTFLDEYPQFLEPYCNILVIGPNGTQVDRRRYNAIQWNDIEIATKELSTLVFGKPVALSTFYGFTEQQLDAQKLEDIAYLVCSMFSINERHLKASIQSKRYEFKIPIREQEPGGLVKYKYEENQKMDDES